MFDATATTNVEFVQWPAAGRYRYNAKNWKIRCNDQKLVGSM